MADTRLLDTWERALKIKKLRNDAKEVALDEGELKMFDDKVEKLIDQRVKERVAQMTLEARSQDLGRQEMEAGLTCAHRALLATDKTVMHSSNPNSDALGWSAHINDTFGTTLHASCEQSLMRIAGVLQERNTTANQVQVDAALALFGAIGPRNELETVIGEQIFASHVLSMDVMHQAKCADTTPR